MKNQRNMMAKAAYIDEITQEEIDAVLNGYTVVSICLSGKKPVKMFIKD